ncbi:hypothetical protein KDL01_26265 [Actinospica durhamensis]|uniref:Uncharacterized protein n=1 Tax=Actinospica durhamensis TaxID=1508375 RepID=A0A941ETA7_9ACTN|nr:hypothetical protein [Actinospica durhamensis]MBR7836813.1 hypothetical protein [Actinospica durhamensis]
MNSVSVEIELDPPHGVTGYPIGMPAGELVPDAVARGRVVISDPGLAGALEHMKLDLTVYLERASFATVFALEDGNTLTWLDIHAPRPLPGAEPAADADPVPAAAAAEELKVTWRGIDVFRTPAAELLRRIEAEGHEVDRSAEPERYTVPGLPLRFTRTAGREDVPRDRDGEPRYMQSVLVAGPGYFDELPDIDFDALEPKPLEHRFVISPLDGAGDFPFGAGIDELIDAATPLGHVRIDDPGHRQPDLYTKLFVTRPSFTAILACEDGETLTAAEFWTPEEHDGDRITVELLGIDVFRTPALDVLDHLTGLGHRLDDADPDYPAFPDLGIGFTRTRGHAVPLAVDGRTAFIQAILTAPAGYYDAPLPPSELDGGEPWCSRLTRPAG